MFEDLLASLDEAERGKLQRSMGMKMEQLKVRSLMVLFTLSVQSADLLLYVLTACNSIAAESCLMLCRQRCHSWTHCTTDAGQKAHTIP